MFMKDFENEASRKADEVVDDCMVTHKLCRQAAAHCIDTGGELSTLERLIILDDCAEINLTLSNFLLRTSRYIDSMLKLCTDVSMACANSIREFEQEDDLLHATYVACLRSHQSCSEYLNITRNGKQDGHK